MITRRGALRPHQGDADGEMDADVTLTPAAEGDNTGTGEARPAENSASASAGSAQATPFQAPEQFLSTLAQLITSMSAGDFRASTPVTPAAAATSSDMSSGAGGSRNANFTRCTARFDGSSRDAEVLEAFLDSVVIYKECAGVSDEHALRGLPILLHGEAAVWWRGIKESVSTWPDALARLRNVYGVSCPAYKVFKDIFSAEQRDDERAEHLICRVRALVSRLPYKLDERVQIDIIYGLLHRRVRKKVPRESVITVDELLCKARIAEDFYKESAIIKGPSAVVSIADPIRSSSSSAPTSRRHRDRPRCTHCKIFGHSTDECRKVRDYKQPASKPTNIDGGATSKVIRCYGCGKQGVVRSKCDTCNPKSVTSNSFIDANAGIEWNSLSVLRDYSGSKLQISKGADSMQSIKISNVGSENVNNSKNFINTSKVSCEMVSAPADVLTSSSIVNQFTQPMAKVSIFGTNGVAILDTGATHSIASPMLYRVLKDSGVQFNKSQRIIRLADGTKTNKSLLTADVPVIIEGREVSCEFLVLPGSETKTLLGMEFLTRAGIVLDIARGKWMFADDLRRRFDFVRTYTIKSSNTGLMCADVTELALRPDEGAVTPEQKRTLNNTLSRSVCARDPDCDVCFTTVDMPRRNSGDIKISGDLETDEPFRGRPWSSRRDTHEKAQAIRKETADKSRRDPPKYQVGDLVLLKTQGANDAGRGQTAKFIPRRDGPYKIKEVAGPATCILENVQTGADIGKYHISHLTPFSGQVEPPVREKRKRGRPRRYLC